jgi:hypothetical protein
LPDRHSQQSMSRSSAHASPPRRGFHNISLRDAFLQQAPETAEGGTYETFEYSPDMAYGYFQSVLGGTAEDEERLVHCWETSPYGMPCDSMEQTVGISEGLEESVAASSGLTC